MTNPLLTLPYEPALADLGANYSTEVTPATFPNHVLRFRNDALLPKLGLAADAVSDLDFIQAFGHFQSKQTDHYSPFLALRYLAAIGSHYNPFLGDGHGFLTAKLKSAAICTRWD